MKDFEARPPVRRDKDPYVTDSTERDPQGWLLKPVSGDELEYINSMDLRGFWDADLAGRAMATLQGSLGPGSRIVVVGKEVSGPSAFMVFSITVAREVRDAGGSIRDAEERNPGPVIAFSDMPTPGELQSFLAANSTELDPMAGWSPTGELPYMMLDSDIPGFVEFGTMDAQYQIRTQATREYAGGLSM